MRIAAAAYPLDWFDHWSDYEAKLSRWVAEAEADLLVFPEYGAMELASLAGPAAAGDLQASIRAVSDRIPDADALHQELAARHGCHILAASAPVLDGGKAVNRARLFTPEGGIGIQDKQIMTRFERSPWEISPGGPLRLFETAIGRIGVLICYDAEFPLLARSLVEAGAEVLLVPSCTDAETGYWRVRIGAMARALEGQCVTVHAPTVGQASWSPAVDENMGAAGIFGPPDIGFPKNAILSLGEMNVPGWVRADVDRAAIAHVRADGAVLNRQHWSEQGDRQVPVLTEKLT